MMHEWMILESLSGFSNSSTAFGVSATEEVHLDNSTCRKVSESVRSVGSVGSPPRFVTEEVHLDNSRTFMAMSISRI